METCRSTLPAGPAEDGSHLRGGLFALQSMNPGAYPTAAWGASVWPACGTSSVVKVTSRDAACGLAPQRRSIAVSQPLHARRKAPPAAGTLDSLS